MADVGVGQFEATERKDATMESSEFRVNDPTDAHGLGFIRVESGKDAGGVWVHYYRTGIEEPIGQVFIDAMGWASVLAHLEADRPGHAAAILDALRRGEATNREAQEASDDRVGRLDQSDQGSEARDAALQFVRAFAITETYGGGRRARIRIGSLYLSSTDGWHGEDAALDELAEKLVEAMNA